MDQLHELSGSLIRRGYETGIFSARSALAEYLLDMVRGKTVGYGGSLTLESLDIFSEIRSFARELYTHLAGRAGEEERAALHADIFLTSANAISLDGHIVNIDGTGNRVAATCFGPERVVFLIGRNKIVPTLSDALVRAKEAAVKNAMRFKRKTPCVTTGTCQDCLSPECVCSITTIHRKKPSGMAVSVLLIDEELGF